MTARNTVISAVTLLFLICPSITVGESLDRVVAVVNGEPITQSELREAIIKRRTNLFADDTGSTSAAGSEDLDALNHLIERRIQTQLATKRGLTVQPEEIETAQRDILFRNGIPSPAVLRQQLENQGLTYEQYREDLKQQILAIKLANREVRAGVILSEEEVRSYYDIHRDDFRLPDKYDLSQIVLAIAPEDDSQGLEGKARQTRDRLLAGEPIDAVARDLGALPHSGHLGWLTRGHMLIYIEEAVSRLEPGGVSDPIRTPAGLHIFRLNDRSIGRYQDFEDVKPKIRERLYEDRTREVYTRWLRDLRNQAQVEIRH